MKREELRWLPQKPDCEGGLGDFKSVGLVDIKPAAQLLIFGYGLSILFLGVEILIDKIKGILFNAKNRNPIRHQIIRKSFEQLLSKVAQFLTKSSKNHVFGKSGYEMAEYRHRFKN